MVAAAAGAAFLLYVGWQVVLRPPAAIEQPVSNLLMGVYALVAAGLGFRLASARRTFDPRLRRAWALLAFSALCAGIETCLQAAPVASAAEALDLAYYPLRLAGILALPFVALRRTERATLWLDLGIVLASGLTGLWYFILAPSVASHPSNPADWVSLAFLVADLILLAGLVVLILRDLERVRLMTVIFLAFSIVLLGGADNASALLQTRGLSLPGGPLHTVWVAASLCDLLAVTWLLGLGQHPPRGSLREAHPARRMLRLGLPYAATLFGMGVLVTATFARPLDPPGHLTGTLLGALCLVALAMLRQSVVLRENIRLQEEAHRLATTDSLTGLHNRRALDAMLEREVERAIRYDHTLSVVLLDLDGFKAYNDRHGHLQGDIALKRVALALRSQIRSIDLLARFGGDEFVVLLPETDWRGARAVGAKMQEVIGKQHIPGSALSLSVGVAEYARGMTPADLLGEADHALYRDKRGGHLHPGGRRGEAQQTRPLHVPPAQTPEEPLDPSASVG
jgi:diguanylate cyclase (GGDEF)-like protein